MRFAQLSKMWQYVTVDKDRQLGKGMYGTAFAGVRAAYTGTRSKWPELEVAVKVPNSAITDHKQRATFMGEIELLASINHPACLSLIAFTIPGDGMYNIVTELMETDLEKVVAEAAKGTARPGWDDTTKSITLLGIAAGLGYLHSKNILHRDVKPANILLDSDYHPKIADFGFAKLIPPEEHIKMTMGKGTPLYMAPEINKGADDYGFPVDVYAFGMMAYVVLTEKIPFEKDTPYTLARKIEAGDRPAIPGYISPEWTNLITRCWDGAPEQRPTFAEMLEDADSFMLDGCDGGPFENYKVELKLE
jgi:serine/threonine protein kinase